MQSYASAIFAAPEQRFDFIVVAQKRDEKVGGPVLEDKTQREAGAALKQFVTQFANAKAAVDVRSTEAFSQLAQSQQALCLFAFGQLPQPAQHARVDGERFSQSSS